MIGGQLDISQIRTLLVDDFYPFRRYMCSTLRKRTDLHVIGEAADGLQAVKLAQQLFPDLVLMDVGLPRLNGIDAAREIRTVCPDAKIVFVSQESSRELAEEALAPGAKGYLCQIHSRDGIVDCPRPCYRWRAPCQQRMSRAPLQQVGGQNRSTDFGAC